jgi:hypothetical protein
LTRRAGLYAALSAVLTPPTGGGSFSLGDRVQIASGPGKGERGSVVTVRDEITVRGDDGTFHIVGRGRLIHLGGGDPFPSPVL